MDNQNQTIHLTKEFSVSKEKLYKSWVEPDQLKQWWKPLNKQLRDITNDVTVGGHVHYGFEEGDFEINGEYLEVVENENLVYTWNWELPNDAVNRGEYILRINFRGDDNNSSIDVIQENFKEEHAIQPHREGWESALEDLKNYLTGNIS